MSKAHYYLDCLLGIALTVAILWVAVNLMLWYFSQNWGL